MRITVNRLLLTLIAVTVVAFYSCSDFIDTGIEGRWQLQQIEDINGKVVEVDTVFYSFKKDVFQYLRLETAITHFYCFGNYSRNSNEITIDIDPESFQPDKYKGCRDCFDWQTLKRTFVVKEESSSNLILESEGETLKFRKY